MLTEPTATILQWILPFFLFLTLDQIWFHVYSLKNIYKPVFQKINNSKHTIRIWSALLAWMILSISVSLFLTFHSYEEHLPYLWSGFIIGFIIYAVYNLTNYASIQNYSLKMTIIDTIWGTLLYGFVLWVCSYL